MNLFSEALQALLGAFFGTLGFAWLMRIPRKAWLPAGIIASLVYLLDWGLIQLGVSEYLAVFCGTLFGSLAGHIYARRMKMINTIFLMSAIVPVVPGLGLYRTMAAFGDGKTALGADLGVHAMMIIGMTALGLAMGSFPDRLFHRERKTEKNTVV